MAKELLSLEHISFCYEEKGFSLKDIHISFGAGEKIAVLGRNGSGKSTFFLLCNGILRPHNGVLKLEGEIIKSPKDIYRLREKVGLVFQDANQQIIGTTVESEISFGPMNLQLPKEIVQRRVQKAMNQMRLSGFGKRPPHELSEGEKKRVCIAGILAMEPQLILLDEPAAFLDPLGVGELESVLNRLEATGRTLIVSTHDMDFAWRWAERLIIFHQGKIIGDGKPEDLFFDDDLLETAGLGWPYLFAMAKILKEKGIVHAPHWWPKTIKEFSEGL